MKGILITSSLLILLIAALRPLLRGRIDPRVQYALWLAVALRLLIPVNLFTSAYSALALLERAARIAPEYGGGSITALPIIETQAGDVSAYIPTNVISITDGQIFLETELFHSGVMPAVNPGISVSRVGGSAQISAMKKVAGTLKLAYSQYRELQSFAQFGSDLDADTKRRLAQGERIVEVLKQDRNAPVPVELQVCILYAVIHDKLTEVAVEDIKAYEKGLYEDMRNLHESDVLAPIRNTGKLDEATEQALDKALDDYTARFLQLKQ